MSKKMSKKMSRKKKKKNKKKKLHRFHELQNLEQAETANSDNQKKSFIKPTNQAEEKEKIIPGEKEKQQKPAQSTENVSENAIFYKDLRRIGIIIVFILVVLAGIWWAFNYTNIFSNLNFSFFK